MHSSLQALAVPPPVAPAAPCPFHAARGARIARAARGEGRVAPLILKDPARRRVDALSAPGETMQQKVGMRDVTSDVLLKHPNTILATYV